jgi:tetratricopeptide (TPR) repeat protein
MAGPRPLAAAPWRAAVIVVAAAAVAWIAAGAVAARRQAARLPALPDLSAVAAPVREAIVEADRRARATPTAAAIGELARVYHASLRAADALAGYALAERLAPSEWRWTYLRALLLEERGDQDATRRALERVTAAAPAFGPAWYRLGELAFKQRRLDDAQAAYERARDAPGAAPFAPPGVTARQTVPLGAYAGLGLARVSLDRGDRDAAARGLHALVNSYPGFGPARALLRAVERRDTAGGEPGALATGPASAAASAAANATPSAPFVPPADPLLDAIVADSRHGDMLLKYAGIATRAKDAAWREFLARRALAFNPRDANVLMEMAGMLQQSGKFDEALDYLRQHEALAPGDHHTLVQQGRVLSDLGRTADAETVLRRAVLVRDTTAEFNLGTILDRQDRWDEARVHYERALAIDPFNTSAMNNLAIGLDRRGQTPAALVLFERAIDIDPGAAEYYVNYGSALIGHKRLDEAIRVLTISIGLEPRAPNAHNNLGIALAQQARLSDARASFERALALDPSHANARRNLELTMAILTTGRP